MQFTFHTPTVEFVVSTFKPSNTKRLKLDKFRENTPNNPIWTELKDCFFLFLLVLGNLCIIAAAILRS